MENDREKLLDCVASAIWGLCRLAAFGVGFWVIVLFIRALLKYLGS